MTGSISATFALNQSWCFAIVFQGCLRDGFPHFAPFYCCFHWGGFPWRISAGRQKYPLCPAELSGLCWWAGCLLALLYAALNEACIPPKSEQCHNLHCDTPCGVDVVQCETLWYDLSSRYHRHGLLSWHCSEAWRWRTCLWCTYWGMCRALVRAPCPFAFILPVPLCPMLLGHDSIHIYSDIQVS